MARAWPPLGVPIELLRYKSLGELADDAPKEVWDVGNIGAEPARAASIIFSAAYCEMLLAAHAELAAIPLLTAGEAFAAFPIATIW